ncbi:MAG: hypothetical protein ACREJ3_20020, partial [Polyangiaceae bacterium]
LEEVIHRALAKRPEDRFASAADFGAALQCVHQGAVELPAYLARTPAPSHAERGAPLRSAPPAEVAPAALVPSSRARSVAAGAGTTKAALLVGIAVVSLLVGGVIAALIMKYVVG